MLPGPLVLVRLLQLLQRKGLLVHHGPQPLRVSLNGEAHVLHLLAATHQDPPRGAQVGQALEEAGLVLGMAADKADNGNQARHLDGL